MPYLSRRRCPLPPGGTRVDPRSDAGPSQQSGSPAGSGRAARRGRERPATSRGPPGRLEWAPGTPGLRATREMTDPHRQPRRAGIFARDRTSRPAPALAAVLPLAAGAGRSALLAVVAGATRAADLTPAGRVPR